MGKISAISNDEGAVDPTDIEHRMRRLERAMSELVRRNAIYERRILILEGKREPGRLDDAEEWDGGVTPDRSGVTPVTEGRNANAERQRRYRDRQKQLPPV